MSEDNTETTEPEAVTFTPQEVCEKQTAKVLNDLAVEMAMPVPKGWKKAELVAGILKFVDESDDDDVEIIFTDFCNGMGEKMQPSTAAPASTAGKIRPLPTRGAGEIIVNAIREFVDNGETINEDEIIATVKNMFPNQNPDSKAIAYYKTLLRNNGYDVPKVGPKVAEPADQAAA